MEIFVLGERYFACLLKIQKIFVRFVGLSLLHLVSRNFPRLLCLLSITGGILCRFLNLLTSLDLLGLMFLGVFPYSRYLCEIAVALTGHYTGTFSS